MEQNKNEVKLKKLNAKPNPSIKEVALKAALVDLIAKEKTGDRVAIDAAQNVVNEAEAAMKA